MKTLITLSMKSGNQLETVVDPEDCDQFFEQIYAIQGSSKLESLGDILYRPCEVEGIATRTITVDRDPHSIIMSEITTSLSWRELRDLIYTIPEEDLDNGIMVKDGGSEILVSELVMTDKWLYLKGF